MSVREIENLAVFCDVCGAQGPGTGFDRQSYAQSVRDCREAAAEDGWEHATGGHDQDGQSRNEDRCPECVVEEWTTWVEGDPV